ncbi:hypothetical protein Q1695_014793 [Nippostrongylus brasiliensis]|nr:hypothetical protein Q1695_014793 [Nippostrongylus brasiliensis]
MDLLDAYQVRDQPISSSSSAENSISVHKLKGDNVKRRNDSMKMKKPRFVPWEPYKAATGADRKGEAPSDLPPLIPYGCGSVDENSNKTLNGHGLLVDTRRGRKAEKRSETEASLEKQLAEMRSELELERKLNAELKRLMVATISDELQVQVEALTEDKIRLAHRVEEYCERLLHEDEQVDQLLIDRDVWKCKFLAQSIRTDELTLRSEFLLGMLRDAQGIVRNMCDGTTVSKEAKYFAELDLTKFVSRSPCDERVPRKAPNFANVTISCCRRCSGREIHLL